MCDSTSWNLRTGWVVFVFIHFLQNFDNFSRHSVHKSWATSESIVRRRSYPVYCITMWICEAKFIVRLWFRIKALADRRMPNSGGGQHITWARGLSFLGTPSVSMYQPLDLTSPHGTLRYNTLDVTPVLVGYTVRVCAALGGYGGSAIFSDPAHSWITCWTCLIHGNGHTPVCL